MWEPPRPSLTWGQTRQVTRCGCPEPRLQSLESSGDDRTLQGPAVCTEHQCLSLRGEGQARKEGRGSRDSSAGVRVPTSEGLLPAPESGLDDEQARRDPRTWAPGLSLSAVVASACRSPPGWG